MNTPPMYRCSRCGEWFQFELKSAVCPGCTKKPSASPSAPSNDDTMLPRFVISGKPPVSKPLPSTSGSKFTSRHLVLHGVIVVAGNMTGDMFGIAAGLLLKDDLGVLILDEVAFDSKVRGSEAGVDVYYSPEEIYKGPGAQEKAGKFREAFPGESSGIVSLDPLGRCKTKDLADFFCACVGPERVFTLPVKSLNAAYTLLKRGDEGAIQYAFLNAHALPSTDGDKPKAMEWRALRWAIDAERLKPDHFAEASLGTKIVGQTKRDLVVRTVRKAWGLLGSAKHSIAFDTFANKLIQTCVDERNFELLQNKRYAVLWVRFSGKKGGPHPQHDTSYTGLRQLIGLCRRQGLGVILAGDQAWSREHARKLADIAKAYEGASFLDLTAMWERLQWPVQLANLHLDHLEPVKSRLAQIALLDFMNRRTKGLVHLGFRSGNLEAYSLIGHRVYYMEEEGNLEAGRMMAWHTRPVKVKQNLVGTRYDRIVIDLPPTRTGKLIVASLRAGSKQRDNMILPWGAKVMGKAEPSDQQRTQSKAGALKDTSFERASHFYEDDLDVIESVLGQAARDAEMVVDGDGITHWQLKVNGLQ